MIRRVDQIGAAQTYDVVIVIAVIRAFTVADYSLNDSAKRPGKFYL
jgi:hypothetical protein